MRDRLLDWLLSKNTMYLLGAGCSRCAGKPLVSQLTELVLADANPFCKDIYDNLRPNTGRKAHIEDLMNHLLRMKDILDNYDKSLRIGDVTFNQICDFLDYIRHSIVNHIGSGWSSSDHHKKFLSRLRPASTQSRDVFTTNYDTVIEDSLDDLRLRYVDGFIGNSRAWFDPIVFEEPPPIEGRFALHKIHGSINWRRSSDQHVRRYVGDDSPPDAVLVYPSEQKYVETRFGVYESLMGRFRNRMRDRRPNNTLVTLGYSFNDEHINEAIFDAICYRESNLTLFSFIGPEDGDYASDKQKSQIQSYGDRCGSRFNAFVGSDFSVTSAFEPNEAAELCSIGLWKFEYFCSFISGEL